MESFLSILATVGVFVTATAGVGCLVAYHVRSHGMWRKTQFGIHLMSFMGGLVGVLILAVIGVVAADHPVWMQLRPYLRAGVWVFLSFLFGWRFFVFLHADKMLLPAQHEDADQE